MWHDLNDVINYDDKIAPVYLKLQESQTIMMMVIIIIIIMMVIIALQLARLLAVKLVENELAKRANEKKYNGLLVLNVVAV